MLGVPRVLKPPIKPIQRRYERIWLVRERDTGEQLVLKEIAVRNQAERDEASNEAAVLAAVSHINIVAFVELYADDGDMQQKIEVRKGRSEHFPQQVVLRWIAQLTQALDHLHRQGIVHRDVKTANLFLTKTGFLKLGDFGVAKVLDASASGVGPTQQAAERSTATPGVGTPMYMAPEVCDSNAPYTTRADCWGIGPSATQILALPVLEAALEGSPATLLRKGKEPRPYSPVISVEERRRSLASQSWAPQIMKVNHRVADHHGGSGGGGSGDGGGSAGRRGHRHHDEDVDVSATLRVSPSPALPNSAEPPAAEINGRNNSFVAAGGASPLPPPAGAAAARGARGGMGDGGDGSLSATSSAPTDAALRSTPTPTSTSTPTPTSTTDAVASGDDSNSNSNSHRNRNSNAATKPNHPPCTIIAYMS
eukprot:gene5644-15536_t